MVFLSRRKRKTESSSCRTFYRKFRRSERQGIEVQKSNSISLIKCPFTILSVANPKRWNAPPLNGGNQAGWQLRSAILQRKRLRKRSPQEFIYSRLGHNCNSHLPSCQQPVASPDCRETRPWRFSTGFKLHRERERGGPRCFSTALYPPPPLNVFET